MASTTTATVGSVAPGVLAFSRLTGGVAIGAGMLGMLASASHSSPFQTPHERQEAEARGTYISVFVAFVLFVLATLTDMAAPALDAESEEFRGVFFLFVAAAVAYAATRVLVPRARANPLASLVVFAVLAVLGWYALKEPRASDAAAAKEAAKEAAAHGDPFAVVDACSRFGARELSARKEWAHFHQAAFRGDRVETRRAHRKIMRSLLPVACNGAGCSATCDRTQAYLNGILAGLAEDAPAA